MADITTGETFTSGETNIDHTKLNNIANLAVINATFVTGKSAVADNVDPATYLMLFVDPAASGTFYKGTINKLFNHTSLINGATPITTLAGTEAFPVYDGANKKITAANLETAVAGSTALVKDQTANTDPKLGDSIVIYDLSATANRKLSLGSLINDAASHGANSSSVDVLAVGNGTTGGAGSFSKVTPYALMAGDSALGASYDALDEFPIRDVSAGVVKRLTVTALMYGNNESTSLAPSNYFIGISGSGGQPFRVNMQNVLASLCPTVVQTQVTASSTQALSAASWTAVTGMSATTGTPFGTASKFVITVSLSCTATAVTYFRLTRGGVAIGVADAASNRILASFGVAPAVTDTPNILNFTWEDSPASAAAVTYALEAYSVPGGSLRVNRTGTDTDSTNFVRMVSTLTVMERPA